MPKKIHIIFPVLLAGLIIIASNGCYYDNEETLYPQGVCDTVDVKYSVQVKKIFENKCYDCHSNATAPSVSNISFEGYANVSGYLTPNSARMIGAINHQPTFVPMPQNRPKLSDCEINTLEIWIGNGFPNN